MDEAVCLPLISFVGSVLIFSKEGLREDLVELELQEYLFLGYPNDTGREGAAKFLFEAVHELVEAVV